MDFYSRKIGRKRKILKIGLAVAIICISVLLVLQEGYYRYTLYAPNLSSAELTPFIIQKGELPDHIAQRLQKEGLIQSSWVFLRYAERSGDAQNFQAGKFYLHANMPYSELSHTLTKAAVDEVSITLLEGFTNQDIDDLLVHLDLAEPGEFLECVQTCDFKNYPFLPKDVHLREGFFFPDTYYVIPARFNVETFAKRLLSTFDQKTKSIFSASSRNEWDILKMASIIEKESRDGDERPIVAGILWKRLDNGWMLGADATTRFITGKKTETLTAEDLSDKNPWNTRAVKGLPPGAICNPGLSSIWAAANPEETQYWYYLHGPNGEIHYGITIDDHSANKADYL